AGRARVRDPPGPSIVPAGPPPRASGRPAAQAETAVARRRRPATTGARARPARAATAVAARWGRDPPAGGSTGHERPARPRPSVGEDHARSVAAAGRTAR